MSPVPSLFYLAFILFVPASLTQEEHELLTRIKDLENPNDIWDFLKKASKKLPELPEENVDDDLDALFEEGDENDDLFKSEEDENEVSTQIFTTQKPLTSPLPDTQDTTLLTTTVTKLTTTITPDITTQQTFSTDDVTTAEPKTNPLSTNSNIPTTTPFQDKDNLALITTSQVTTETLFSTTNSFSTTVKSLFQTSGMPPETTTPIEVTTPLVTITTPATTTVAPAKTTTPLQEKTTEFSSTTTAETISPEKENTTESSSTTTAKTNTPEKEKSTESASTTTTPTTAPTPTPTTVETATPTPAATTTLKTITPSTASTTTLTTTETTTPNTAATTTPTTVETTSPTTAGTTTTTKIETTTSTSAANTTPTTLKTTTPTTAETSTPTTTPTTVETTSLITAATTTPTTAETTTPTTAATTTPTTAETTTPTTAETASPTTTPTTVKTTSTTTAATTTPTTAETPTPTTAATTTQTTAATTTSTTAETSTTTTTPTTVETTSTTTAATTIPTTVETTSPTTAAITTTSTIETTTQTSAATTTPSTAATNVVSAVDSSDLAKGITTLFTTPTMTKIPITTTNPTTTSSKLTTPKMSMTQTTIKPQMTTTMTTMLYPTKSVGTPSKPMSTTTIKSTTRKPVIVTKKVITTTSKKPAINKPTTPVKTTVINKVTTKLPLTKTTARSVTHIATKKSSAITTKSPATTKGTQATPSPTKTISKSPATSTTKKVSTPKSFVALATRKPTKSLKTTKPTTKKPLITTKNPPAITKKSPTTTKKPPKTTKKLPTTTKKPTVTTKKTLVTTKKSVTTTKKYLPITKSVTVSPKVQNKHLNRNSSVEDDLLPPPPLPPLPPPPLPPLPLPPTTCNKCGNQEPASPPTPKLCPGLYCNIPPRLPLTTPRIHSYNHPTLKHLEPKKTFIIDDDPITSTAMPSRSQTGSSLLPQRTFLIAPSNPKPSTTTQSSIDVRLGNSGRVYPRPNIYWYPNQPVEPNRGGIPNELGNRLGVSLPNDKPVIYVSHRDNPQSIHFPHRGSVPVFPHVNEGRTLHNQPHHQHVRPNTQVGRFPTNVVVPVLITRQNIQPGSPAVFVKPKFDFIITNVSNSHGGQFQIKPIVRSPDSVRFHVHGQRGTSVNPVGPHVQGQDMVYLVKSPAHQPHHPPSAMTYYPTNGGSAPPSYRVSFRSKRSVPDDTATDIEGSSLVFVFDTTGSMSSELRQVQQQATKLARAMTVHPDKPIYDYLFVPFNDPAVGPVTRTRDHDYFQSILDGIRVDGGGDCPEMSLSGLLLALENSLPGSFIYVFTDAGAKDSHLQENVLKLIQRKQSTVLFLLTGNCYTRDPAYDIISSTSGGQVYDLEKTDVNEVWESIKRNLNSRKVNLASINSKVPALMPKPYSMPIDENLGEFTVSISGRNSTLSLYEPNGTLAVPPKVKDLLNLPNIKVVNVPDPEPGTWTVKVGSHSDYTVRSSGLSKTNVKFSYGFSVIPTTNIAETAHRPLQGTQNSLLIKTSLPTRDCNLTHISLLDFEGQVFAQIILTPADHEEGIYVGGPIVPPNKYFNMQAHGYDSRGNSLVRIFPSAITPQLPDLPEVSVKPRVQAILDTSLELECHVESLVPITIKWFKNGKFQTSVKHEQSSKSILRIDNVSQDSAGNYSCWTANIAGTTTKSIYVTVAGSPEVYVTNEVRYPVGRPAKISCQTQSDLPYNVTWSRKKSNSFFGDINEETLSFSSKTPSDERQNFYSFDYLKIDDEGWYTCTAASRGGSKKGNTFLKVLSPPVVEKPGPVKFTNRSPLVISCKLLRPEPSVRVTWEKLNSPIKDPHSIEDGSQYNDYSYQLIIPNPDRRDEGFYKCIVENNVGQVVNEIRVTYVSEPKIVAEKEEVMVKEGSTAILRCILTDGTPAPTITWYKRGIQIIKYPSHMKVLDNGSVLRIENVSEGDESKYFCFARNEVGESRAAIDLQIGVEPSILEPERYGRGEVGFGGSLDIPCKAVGKPTPVIVWSKKASRNTYEFYQTTLKIQDAKLDDEGEYTCTAKNSFGHDEVSVNVSITGLEKPIISGSGTDSRIKGLVGQRMELSCALLAGNPLPNTTWFKDGIRLIPNIYNNIVLENGSFIIPVLTLRHIGNYKCLVQNAVGSDSKQYTLSTYDAPKMNMSLGSFLLAKVGTNVTLPCHIRGDPQPVVTWYKENAAVDRPFRGFRINDSDNLYITSVLEEDSGRFICKAENIAGIARRAVTLSVISPPRILNFPQEVSAISGDVVFLNCPTAGTPRPTIRWLKNNKPIYHVRGSLGNNYLRFFSDPSDAGEYTCIAENKAGEDRASTHLTILEPPKIDETTDDVVEGILGGNVELPCYVTGTPKPFVIWQHKGQTIKKILPSGNVSANLQLSKLSEDDKGPYACIASNKAGTNRKTVELSVLVPPIIEDWEGPFRVIPGDTITVTCSVSGFPKPTVKWVKNELPLSPEFFTHDNILRFIVESSHSGNYTCLAMNKAGYASKDVLISVYEAPKFLLEQSEDMEVLEGSDVRVHCSAIGNPRPVINWFYNGRILESKNNIRFFQEKDVMTVHRFNEDNEGIYECTATNKAGSNSRSIKINVLVPPKITKWSDDMSVREGNEVILTCDVKGKPEPIVAWKKNSVPLPSDLTYRGNKIRFIATANDKGNYSCLASNKVGSDIKHTFLTVKVHPQIVGDQEEEKIVVLLGDGLELKCEATGVPQPTISWNFNSTLINNLPNAAFKLKGSNLFIPKVDFHNEGVYVCIANNSLGTAQKTFEVTVHVPPTITDDSQDMITLNEGDDFSISCSAYGVPIPDILWMYNDTVFKKEFPNEHYVVMNDHTLIMSDVKLDMSGNYYCIATNLEGSDIKNYTIEVLVTPKDPASENNNLTLVEIEESDDGVLNCPITEGTIHWLKDDDGIDLSGNERADDIHLQLLEGGKALKLTESYSSDSGIYTCYTDNGQSYQFLVKVLIRPYFVQEFPQTDFELKLGDQLTLDCNAAGNPIPKINWRHVDKDIPITKHTVPGVLVKGDEKDTLHFPAVKTHHAGRYMCLASNKVGKEARIFTIKVTEPPVLVGEAEEKITAVAGNILDLDCRVNGSPTPKYTWTHTSFTGKKRDLVYSKKKFMINSLRPADGGIYMCNGTNKIGSTTKYFFVFILEEPQIKGNNVEDIWLAEGKEMEVECEAYGVPMPTLTWQRDSRQIDSTRAIITSNKPHMNSTQASTLRIKAVDETVAGIYTCLASNDVATTQKHFRLSIIAPPVLSDQSFLFNKKSMDINEGQSIYLSCPARQDQRVKVEWYVHRNESMEPIDNNNLWNLYISSAKPSDNGLYTCVVSNDAGKVEASFIISISEPPTFVSNNYEKSLILTQDDDLILNCSVKSKPQSQIIWLRDGLRLTQRRNADLTLLKQNQTLIISDIKADDSGKYLCIASNNAGSIERSFQVDIHEAPMVPGISSINMETNSTETQFSRVILRCPLTGSPQPVIKWFKDGSLIEENENIYITPNGEKLIIFYLTEEEGGRYSCTAQNQAGVNKLFFNLKVKITQVWSPWSDWSECDKPCDRGKQIRNRTCGEEPPLKNQLNPYIEYDKKACRGSNSDVKYCNTHPCKIDGGWGDWSFWSSCSVTCGQGTRTRSRRCNNPAPAFGGSRCVGSHMVSTPCHQDPCAIDGNWSAWSEWSDCTVSCGEGLTFRERRCNSPEPEEGGKPCPGSYRDVKVCNQQKCPIHGRWSGWGKWSNCSAKCGLGKAVRYRYCHKPLYGGLPCHGPGKEERFCEIEPCKNEAYAEALRATSGVVFEENDALVHQKDDSLSDQPLPTEINVTRSNVAQSELGSIGSSTRTSGVTNSSRVDPDGFPLNQSDLTTSESRTRGVNIFFEDFSRGGGSASKNVTFEENVSDHLLTSDELRTHYKLVKCPTGYRHNKTSNHCQDINECRHKKWNRCKKYKSNCINTVGSYKCVCAPGYRLQEGSKKKCIDINECKEKKAQCSHFCHNTKGSYKCSCPDGLTLLEDTHTCLKDASDYNDYISDDISLYENDDSDKSVSEWAGISEYDKSEPGFQKDSKHVAEFKSSMLEHELICPKGFIKQENGCKDINECALDLHNCTAEEVCLNTPGYYKCIDAPCPSHYDLSPSIRTCHYDCQNKTASKCHIGAKIADVITYETFDTENKTLAPLQDLVLLIAYDEKRQIINSTEYSLDDSIEDLPVAVRKENNLGMLHTTGSFYLKGLKSVDVIGITRRDNSSEILYSHHFVVFLYNSFTINDVDQD